MPDPARAIENPSSERSVLAAMADYAARFTISGEPAIEAARHGLIDGLARGLEALRDPERAALVGPIVPGAVMPGGSRVPGTSLELEPSQAAFCITLMLSRPGDGASWLTSRGARAPDPLGAILAAADYRARKAVMEGKPPPKVRDLLVALLKALEIRGALAAVGEDQHATGAVPLRFARVAATAIVAAQLGGTQGQIVRAVSYACIDGDMLVDGDRASADAIGGAVRHACQAMAPGRPSFMAPADLEVASLADRLLGAGAATPESRFGTAHVRRLVGPREPQEIARLTTRFRAAVERGFPARHAERVKALFAVPERLDDLPVNELLAALVTNGAPPARAQSAEAPAAARDRRRARRTR